MSTLSELIPSGGTQNNIEFVAQGTLANGQTVGLRSDGKIEAIVETPISQSLGAEASFGSGNFQRMASVYDATADRYIVSYAQFDNGYTYLVVCNNTAATLSFGTPVTLSTTSYSHAGLAYDADVNKTVVSYADGGNSYYGTARVVIVSGDAITLGAASVYVSAGTSDSSVASTYHVASARVITAYNQTSDSSGKVIAIKATASNTVGFGTAVEFCPSNAQMISITYGASSVSGNRFNIGFRDTGTNNWPRMITGTVSGSAITLATGGNIDEVTASRDTSVAYSTENDYYVFCYRDSNVKARAVKIGSNGNISAYGAVITLQSAAPLELGSVYDPINKVVYVGVPDTSNLNYYTLSVSSSGTLTPSSATALRSANTGGLALAYSSEKQRILFSYGYTQFFSRALTLAGASTNVSSYIGITNAAISSGATGEVAVKGGLSTTADLGTFTPSFSTPVRYTTSNSAQPACSVCYDTTNDRYVMFYTDSTNSNYGYATVGTYSSGTTTWGTPVAVNSVNSSNVKAVFDASQGKVLFVYTNGSDSSKLVSAVGTVSGTSISVGSAVTMSASLTSTANTSVTYDANANRSLVLTKVGSDSSKVYASVVSISGTTPAFNGTAVLTGTLATTQNIASCFDPDTNKVAAFVYDANANTTSGYVVTVSASSFSTSAGLSIGIGEALGMLSEYSTVANQVLVFVKPSAVSASQARTFTVAATLSASSDWVNVVSNSVASSLAIAEDVSKSVIVLVGQDEISGAQGKVSLATISGASLTVTTATVFQASAANPATAVYNPDSSNVLIGYRNGSSYGTSAIVSVTADSLVIGSNYFVQDDGSLATTSSSNKAGKAISTTALNLVDPT